MLLRSGILLITVTIFVLLSCSTEPDHQETGIARIDGHTILLDDFRRFYELDANFGIDSSGYPALQDELLKLIDHHLAYRKAVKSGIAADSDFVRFGNWEQKQAMLRELYRQRVSEHVSVSEAEIDRAFRESHTKLRVRHLFTEDFDNANALYGQLEAGADFQNLAAMTFQDSVLRRNGGELGWFAAGELDEEFADAALSLGKMEVSTPVKTRWGYHIIQLLDRKDEVMLTETMLNAERSALEKRLRRKKSQELANQYISDYMQDINPQPNSGTFRKLWNAVVSPDQRESRRLRQEVLLNGELIDEAIRSLRAQLHRPIVDYRGGQISLGEYLQALRNMPVSNRPRFRTRRQLSNHIGIWIRDRLLFEEAQKAGLADHPRVQQEVDDFLNRQAYLTLLQSEAAAIEVGSDVQSYFASGDRRALQRHAELSHFHTLQEWIWHRAEKQLHSTLQIDGALVEFDSNLLNEESRRIDWDRRIRMFAIRKPF